MIEDPRAEIAKRAYQIWENETGLQPRARGGVLLGQNQPSPPSGRHGESSSDVRPIWPTTDQKLPLAIANSE